MIFCQSHVKNMSKYNADYPSKSSRLRHIKYHNYLLVECVFSTFDNKMPMIDRSPYEYRTSS